MSQNFETGAQLVMGAVLLGIFIWMHFRISKLETRNARLQQGVTDGKIEKRDHSLSDDELNDLLDKNLKSGNPKT